MAVDPLTILHPPIAFGKCFSNFMYTNAKCSAWEEPEHPIYLSFRKRGNLVEVMIPEILFKSKTAGNEEIIEIPLNLSDYDRETYFGEYPKSMQFSAVGMTGCPLNNDKLTNELCTCTLLLSFDGKIYIGPSENDNGFTPSSEGAQIGLLSTTISFMPNNQMYDLQPVTKIARLDKFYHNIKM